MTSHMNLYHHHNDSDQAHHQLHQFYPNHLKMMDVRALDQQSGSHMHQAIQPVIDNDLEKPDHASAEMKEMMTPDSQRSKVSY